MCVVSIGALFILFSINCCLHSDTNEAKRFMMRAYIHKSNHVYMKTKQSNETRKVYNYILFYGYICHINEYSFSYDQSMDWCLIKKINSYTKLDYSEITEKSEKLKYDLIREHDLSYYKSEIIES